jgi:hypothetical protein
MDFSGDEHSVSDEENQADSDGDIKSREGKNNKG